MLSSPSSLFPFLSPCVLVLSSAVREADDSSPQRLHHVQLSREGSLSYWLALPQELHAPLFRTSMHPSGRGQQAHVGVCVGHRVAPHAASLLQVGLALLLHQRGERRGVGGGVVPRDGDLRLEALA